MTLDLEQTRILMEKGLDAAITYGPRIIGVVVILFIGRWLAGRFARLTKAGMERAKLDGTLSQFGANMTRYFVLLITGLFCLELFGVKTTSFVAVLGAAGFAVGLALQGTLANFSAGVMLLFFRPFSVGDYVQAGGEDGQVTALGIFSTSLRTPNGTVIVVPNGGIYGGTIKNYSPSDRRRVDVVVGVAYDADIDTARAVLTEMIKGIELVDQTRDNHVYLLGLGASSVDFEVRAYGHPDNYWPVRDALFRGSKYALEAAGIGIPYTTIDLNIVSNAGDEIA